jgi:hypothetical protein
MNVKKYYCETYPSDELGEELNENIHFDDVLILLNEGNGSKIYDLLGVFDSLVRERIFQKLSEITLIDYSIIYDRWLDAN